jgi:hypothetical protein
MEYGSRTTTSTTRRCVTRMTVIVAVKESSRVESSRKSDATGMHEDMLQEGLTIAGLTLSLFLPQNRILKIGGKMKMSRSKGGVVVKRA